MAPSVLNSKEKNVTVSKDRKFAKIKKKIKEYQKFIKENFNYVGDNFAYEARSLHYDDKKKSKNIYGNATSEEISELKEEGVEVLFDDREESAGVKFNDADLIGLPVRLVVSLRNLKQCAVEVMSRGTSESKLVSRDDVVDFVKEMIKC